MTAGIENWLSGQKDQLILWFPIFLGTGSAIYFTLSFEPSLFLTASVFAFSAALLLTAFTLRHKIAFTAFFLALSLCLIAGGLCLAKIKTATVATPILTKETRPLMVEGRVAHVETLEGRKGRLIVLDRVSAVSLAVDETPRKLRLTSKLRVHFETGDRIRVLARLNPPTRPVMPGSYDFRRHYFFGGIGATGFILKTPEVLEKAAVSEIPLVLENIRSAMSERIRSVLPSRLSGIATALITGERAAIEDDDWEALRNSGLAHIISISGLHVVLIAAPIFFIVRLLLAAVPYLALYHPIKKYAALAALLACTAYVLLVVPTVPTYRALLMTGIGLVAIMLDRSPFSLRLISFAAIVVLVLDPESIWSASFQLSFAAVLSLILSAEWTREHWTAWRNDGGRMRKFLLYLGGSVFTTLVVSVVTAPLASFHFQQIPIYSVIGNALIIPLSALVIMPMTILTFALWPFGLEAYALHGMGYGIEWMLAVAHGTAQIPGASWRLPAWPLSSLVCFTLAGLSVYLLTGKMRLAALVFAACGVGLILTARAPVMLISETGQLVMIRDENAVYLSSDRRQKFFAENWLKRFGLAAGEAQILPKEGRLGLSNGEVVCGGSMCRYQTPELKITFGGDYYALKQDCEWADAIVTETAFRDRDCRARIFNKFRLNDSGSVALYADGHIETVADSLGRRPWSPQTEKFKTYKSRPNDSSGSGSTTRLESVRGRE